MQRNEIPEAVVQDASALKVGIVVSKYYKEINEGLLQGVLETLAAWGVLEKNISIKHVSGSYEIPYGCLFLLEHEKPDTIVTLGCIVKGETSHDELIASSVSQGLNLLMLQYKIPIALGIVTVNNMEQATARSTGKDNRGKGAAIAAMEMALLK